MWWAESFIDIIIKGVIIGIILSAPMGPVGVLCIQRTLNKGRLFGFATGIGAALSDFIYCLITGYGMSYVVDIIENPQNMFYLKLMGSVLLFIFGVYVYRGNPTKEEHTLSNKKGTLVQNLITGFFVTFSNPLIIFLIIALFARFTFVIPDSVPNYIWMQVTGYLFIVVGALLWWFGLTYVVNKIRTNFSLKKLVVINHIIGGIVMVASVVGFVWTLKDILINLFNGK